MSYEATVEFKFNSSWTHAHLDNFNDDDFLPEEHLVISAAAGDLNYRQYFKLFEKFMLAVGMSPYNIREGAMSLIFNEWVSEEDQRKVCEKYRVTMDEDLHEKFMEWKDLDEKIKRLNDVHCSQTLEPEEQVLSQWLEDEQRYYGDGNYYETSGK